MNDPLQAPPPDKGMLQRRRSRSGPSLLEAALAIAVIGVAIAALLVAWRSTEAMRSLAEREEAAARAMVTPLLRFQTDDGRGSGADALSYRLVNEGLGPATVGWFELRYRGRALPSHWALIETFGYRPSGGVTTAPVAGTMIRPGEARVLFRWDRPADGDPVLLSWNRLNEVRGTLEAEACYCSVMGECFISLLNEVPPRRVAACDRSGRVSIAG